MMIWKFVEPVNLRVLGNQQLSLRFVSVPPFLYTLGKFLKEMEHHQIWQMEHNQIWQSQRILQQLLGGFKESCGF